MAENSLEELSKQLTSWFTDDIENALEKYKRAVDARVREEEARDTVIADARVRE